MHKLLRLAAAALVAQQIGLAPATAAAPSREELEVVAALARTNSVEEIRAYVAAHPNLVAPESPLARLLTQIQDPALASAVIAALNESLSNITVSPGVRDAVQNIIY